MKLLTAETLKFHLLHLSSLTEFTFEDCYYLVQLDTYLGTQGNAQFPETEMKLGGVRDLSVGCTSEVFVPTCLLPVKALGQ